MKKKEYKGIVESVAMTSTVKVGVSTPKRHAKYGKVMKRTKSYLAHTDVELTVGEEVVIKESKPYSKNVKWKVVKENGTETK
jgi:small subunit ribosomal protein S17